MKTVKLSTACYKGTRDFYPDEMRIRKWMFSVMRSVVDSYGYEEYDGPMIESIEIYKAKSGEEIVERQLYDFVDKGERHVAIRPEMTPTLARMVAARSRELAKPIRWYSIPNLWRYEQPGKGRMREHWQLNVDVFGVNSINAEVEIIQLACDILYAFKAPKESFRVKVSNRKLLDEFFNKSLALDETRGYNVSKILDKKNKITPEEFENLLKNESLSAEQIALVNKFLVANLDNLHELPGLAPDVVAEVTDLFYHLDKLGLRDQVDFDPSVIRGFDYYTGTIFEIFDTSPENRRSLYGGGRYDNLTGLFGGDGLSGTGFGLGDVTMQNFLQTHGLIPVFEPEDTLFFPLMDEGMLEHILAVSSSMRREGIKCVTMLDPGVKLKKQLSVAEKKGYKYVVVIGEEEKDKKTVLLKNMKAGEQTEIPLAELAKTVKEEMNS